MGRGSKEKAIPAVGSEGRQTRKIIVWVLSAFVSVILCWTLLSSVLTSSLFNLAGGFVIVPGFKGLSPGKPVQLGFIVIQKDAFLKQSVFHQVWVIKKSGTQATVFSPICTHLGCRFGWNSSRKVFMCPCHGSVFSEEGKVIAGPAPRQLDTLDYKIENGELYVKWERFESGIPVKKEE